MATKNLNLDEIVQPYIGAILGLIKSATAKGFWQGIDGAQQYIDGDRLKMLEHRDEKAYKHALKLCFQAIVEVSISKGTETVLKGFVSTHQELITSFAKSNPEFFSNREIYSHCKRALGSSLQRVFDSNLANKEKTQKAR